MSHVRQGQLTSSGQWAKHLRKYWKRAFWKAERASVKTLDEDGVIPQKPAKRAVPRRKKFGIEYHHSPHAFFGFQTQGYTYYQWYVKERDRDQAFQHDRLYKDATAKKINR